MQEMPARSFRAGHECGNNSLEEFHIEDILPLWIGLLKAFEEPKLLVKVRLIEKTEESIVYETATGK
jgi:hypothetical protein